MEKNSTEIIETKTDIEAYYNFPIFIRILLVISGSIAVVLGVLGIFLPILPTTPFLLLAALCYARSSKRFYTWLLNNRWFGNYIRNYREKRAIPLKIKVSSITILWVTILVSAIFFVPFIWVKILLIFIATGVTIHIAKLHTL